MTPAASPAETTPLPVDPIDWSDPARPRSTRYGAPFSPADAAGPAPCAGAQAEAVFLRGNGLPARWRGRPRFVIAETGFGLGTNVLATWDAWQRDPQRPARLIVLSLDAHPVQADDLRRAHAQGPLAPLAAELAAAWPPRTPGWHRLDLAGGAFTLVLAWGDVATTLPQWVAQVDAFFLDGFAPPCNPAMWRPETLAPLTRLAAPGATAAAAHADSAVGEALRAAGFACETHGSATVARFVPRRNDPPAGRLPLAPNATEAVVLGAGIAGACAAHALRRAGLAVRVIDHQGPAQGASGNPAGLFHGTVHADDGPHARWNRAAALRCAQWQPMVPLGLLRLAANREIAALYDPAYVQDLDRAQASAAVTWPVTDGGLFYPGGGALAPADWVHSLLADIPLTKARCTHMEPLPDGRWRLRDADGRPLAETGLLVLAAGHGLPALLQAPLPLQAQRGAVSWWWHEEGPSRPVAAGGYVVRTADRLLAGATADLNDADPHLRASDHAHNRAVAERLLSRPLPAPDGGRVAWRLLAADKLPLVGGLVDPNAPPPRRATQAAQWARRPGLLVVGALASRGLTWGPLAAELGVALALGEPAPVERGLVEAVDPARFAVRTLRRG